MNEDESIRDALANSASKLDAAEPPTPDFKFFKDMVEKHQKAAHRSQKRQLMLFIIVAAALVSAIIVCMGQFLFFIIALQGAAVAGAITGLTVFFMKSRRLRAGASQ